jgi:fatty acid desaturase
VTEQAGPEREEHGLGRRVATVALWVAIAIVVLYVGSAFLPRWWSHRVGDQVDGSIATGIALGLLYGFVFTFVPLGVLGLTFRKRRSWRVALAMLAVAVVLAGPNLLTLGIVVGNGHAAHAGERTLDVEAPDFRASSLVGAILGGALFVALGYLVASRRRARAHAARLQAELHTVRESREPPPTETSGS